MSPMSNAERQAAHRERKQKEREQADQATLERDLAAKARGLPSEDEYVRRMVAEAGAYADEIGETDKPFKLHSGETIVNRRTDRLERAGRYARWRYRGFLSGEVASL